MTQEEKQLLLKDICARLPYGVKVWYKYYPINITEKFATSIRLVDNKIALSSKFTKEGSWHPIEESGEILIKPYLRHMSSMTEEEYKEFSKISGLWKKEEGNYFSNHLSELGNSIITERVMVRTIDWLNKNMFDYRGLIPMGLAIEAKEGMYKNE